MSQQERAVLAGGCFWGMQDLIRKMDGVISTRVGYSGGDVANATYRHHGTHAEAIEVIFDPARLSYRTLLEFFFQVHDPTTRNRQGNDVGMSYRSAIYYHQRRAEAGRRGHDRRRRMPRASGRAASSPRWRRQVRSGRPSPSTRTTCSGSRTATPATSSGRGWKLPVREAAQASRHNRPMAEPELPNDALSKAIAALEAQRPVLGSAIVDAALAPLLAQQQASIAPRRRGGARCRCCSSTWSARPRSARPSIPRTCSTSWTRRCSRSAPGWRSAAARSCSTPATACSPPSAPRRRAKTTPSVPCSPGSTCWPRPGCRPSGSRAPTGRAASRCGSASTPATSCSAAASTTKARSAASPSTSPPGSSRRRRRAACASARRPGAMCAACSTSRRSRRCRSRGRTSRCAPGSCCAPSRAPFASPPAASKAPRRRWSARDAELAQLVAAFEATLQTRSLHALTLLAEAGLGKSRLIQELQQRLEGYAQPCWLLLGRALPSGTLQPYGLLRDVLAWRLQIADGDSAEVARRRLVEGLAPLSRRARRAAGRAARPARGHGLLGQPAPRRRAQGAAPAARPRPRRVRPLPAGPVRRGRTRRWS